MKIILKAAAAAGLLMLVIGGGAAGAARLITGANIKNSSITGIDIKNRSLTPRDFRGSVQGPQGIQGPAGAPGAAGAAGAAGAPGTVAGTVEALGPAVPTGVSGSGNEVQSSKAECPAGTVVTGGGFHGGVVTFIADAAKSGNGYFVIAVNDGPIAGSIQAQAICGTAAGAAPRSSPATQSSARAAEDARLAAVRAQVATR